MDNEMFAMDLITDSETKTFFKKVNLHYNIKK